MALDQPGTLNHSIPAIVFLVLCPVVLTMVIIYYLVTYCVRKDRQRREEERDSGEHKHFILLPTIWQYI